MNHSVVVFCVSQEEGEEKESEEKKKRTIGFGVFEEEDENPGYGLEGDVLMSLNICVDHKVARNVQKGYLIVFQSRRSREHREEEEDLRKRKRKRKT